MILGRDPLTALVLILKFSENMIIGSEGPYEGCLESMVDLSNYKFKSLTEKIFKQEESFITSYFDEYLESKSTISSTHRMHIILEAKYKNSDLNKFMT